MGLEEFEIPENMSGGQAKIRSIANQALKVVASMLISIFTMLLSSLELRINNDSICNYVIRLF